MDNLVLPFVFTPDCHRDAVLPPLPGWIRLRATLTPDRPTIWLRPAQSRSSFAAGWASDVEGGDALDSGHANAHAHGLAGAFSPAIPALDLISRMTTLGPSQIPGLDTIGIFVLGRSDQQATDRDVAAIEQGRLQARIGKSSTGSRETPRGNSFVYLIGPFTSQAIGIPFAGPGAPTDQADPRIVAAQAQVTQAAEDVMNQVNRGKLIVPANRAWAGTVLHRLFADEIESRHIPGIKVEESFSLGDTVKYW